MIAFLTGTLSDLSSDSAVIDVGGIGFEVKVSGDTLQALSGEGIGASVRIYTYTYIREDQLALYGFLSREELNLFKRLITVGGIGPKGALALLSTMTADDLRFAIVTGDVKMISRAPGIGKRTAERVILELRDRLSKEYDNAQLLLQHSTGLPEEEEEEAQASDGSAVGDAVAALVALGYTKAEAAGAVRKCGETEETGAILRAALRYL